jgi:hypothetical protein
MYRYGVIVSKASVRVLVRLIGISSRHPIYSRILIERQRLSSRFLLQAYAPIHAW